VVEAGGCRGGGEGCSMHGVTWVGAEGFGRAILIRVALTSTKIAAVIGSSPCFFGHGSFLYSIDEYMALAWMGSGRGAGILPLSGGEIHWSKSAEV
jgi:hypothetical protein